MKIIEKNLLDFLARLEKNNDRDWFNEHKSEFKEHQTQFKSFANDIHEALNKYDLIDRLKIFRIYRDVRFSKNKLPYKSNFSASFHRVKPELRGGYYVHVQPGGRSFIATGFWNPEKDDLHRIRKELEMDATELRQIINDKTFNKIWGSLEGEELKSAPRDFDKNHKDIDLIRKKQYIFTRKFTDSEVTSQKFSKDIDISFKAIRPFFDYMSDVLTTDLNGESTI